MHVRVTCAGIVIGMAEFEPASGLPHATLDVEPGYSFAAAAARELGHEFGRTQFWSPISGDFADEAARRWSGDRLALEDLTGRELGVNNIVVVEYQTRVGGEPRVTVVADFRPDLARVEALLRTVGSGGGRTRPAA